MGGRGQRHPPRDNPRQKGLKTQKTGNAATGSADTWSDRRRQPKIPPKKTPKTHGDGVRAMSLLEKNRHARTNYSLYPGAPKTERNPLKYKRLTHAGRGVIVAGDRTRTIKAP